MTGGFGRKGLAAGGGGQASPAGFGMGQGLNGRAGMISDGGLNRAAASSGPDHMSPELRAFLAAERANRPVSAVEGGVSEVAQTAIGGATRTRGKSGGAKKSMLLAYVLWHFGSAIAAHRFYLGAYQSALMLSGLFWGGLVLMLLWPPLGLVSLAGWLIWLLADLFLIPGLTRRANADEVDYQQLFA